MALPTLENLDGQPLFVLAGQHVRDGQGKTLGRGNGRHLEVDGRRRGRFEGGQVFDAHDQPLLELVDDELRALDGRVLGRFVGGEANQRGWLALAYATLGPGD